MAHYKPVFKEKALVTGGRVGDNIKIKAVSQGKAKDITLSFRAIYRLKRDANEASHFYRSINSYTRVIKKKDGYWVYAGR